LSRLVRFCDIDQRRLALIDSIVIIAGMHRRGRADASVNPYPPNAGDGGARAATSFVANFMRSEDARDEPPSLSPSLPSSLFARRREGRVERHARRTTELKAQQIETELAALEDAPSIIALHPALLDQYIRTAPAVSQ
jgi:hypothetical protein